MKTENTLTALLDKVINDLETRQDYTSVKFKFIDCEQTVSAGAAVQSYINFKQKVLLQITQSISISLLSIDEVINITQAIIASNIAMQKMGPLSTNRTIAPGAAQENNLTLKALLDELMILKAANQTGPIAPSPTQLIYGPKET